MKSFKQITFGLLLLLVLSDLSSADMRICGNSLTELLDMLCVDGFNSKDLKAKRSDPSFGLNFDEKELDPLSATSLFLNKFSDNEHSLMAKIRRRRFDGVADECCRKPCAMSELLSYCL